MHGSIRYKMGYTRGGFCIIYARSCGETSTLLSTLPRRKEHTRVYIHVITTRQITIYFRLRIAKKMQKKNSFEIEDVVEDHLINTVTYSQVLYYSAGITGSSSCCDCCGSPANWSAQQCSPSAQGRLQRLWSRLISLYLTKGKINGSRINICF